MNSDRYRSKKGDKRIRGNHMCLESVLMNEVVIDRDKGLR